MTLQEAQAFVKKMKGKQFTTAKFPGVVLTGLRIHAGPPVPTEGLLYVTTRMSEDAVIPDDYRWFLKACTTDDPLPAYTLEDYVNRGFKESDIEVINEEHQA